MVRNPGTVTQLLQAWSAGDSQALEELIPLVFSELRKLARSQLRREGEGHILQPTALVNELYLRLVAQQGLRWESRVQFFAFSAELMRRILVDHYRAHRTAKRGGGTVTIPLDEAIGHADRSDIDLLDLHDALTSLAALDSRQSRIVELRFFGGLTLDEIAEAIGLSVATVRREWITAKAWLIRELRHK